MDITLERILSLIPKKENGDFQHGAKKEFAQNIGLKSGNLISDWINGRSESYTGYLYEISAKYGVSVEWLRGETNEKSPSKDGLMDSFTYAAHGYSGRLTEADKATILKMMETLAAANEEDNGQTDGGLQRPE